MAQNTSPDEAIASTIEELRENGASESDIQDALFDHANRVAAERAPWSEAEN